MTGNLQGSCQCGQIRYQLQGKIAGFYLCHCSRCRKDSGSAHAANLFCPQAVMEWLAGGELAVEYKVPETRHRKCFCPTCGSSLPYRLDDGTWLVPAGSLDSELVMKPSAHIFMDSKAAWDRDWRADDDPIPCFEGFPGR
ncbi:GFA family protein [Oceanobacter mangrovi]|uniref:GFA family protein n=1 Tax=Oceanobacter mangrovi TaxID=2862510 RepID=UPI001C8DEBDA|nr:GFA family protein [Oceanobacter mangrovi]